MRSDAQERDSAQNGRVIREMRARALPQRSGRRPGVLALTTASILVGLAGVAVASGLLTPGGPSSAGSLPDPSVAAFDTPGHESLRSPSMNAASPTRSPAANNSPAAVGSTAIVPGTVNRTSINLVATYDANVELGYGDRSLRVDVTINVTNRSGAGIDRVELNTITGPLGNLRLRIVQVDGKDVVASVRDQTIVVPLGGVLPDDATAVLRVKLRATLRSTLGGSSWMFTRTGGIVQANRWVPWVGLHRPFDRPNHGDPFFTALSPHVRVRITTDRKLAIATPGRRVAVAGLTQTFEADNVRDFPIVASPYFSIRERTVGAWKLRAFVRSGFPTGTVLDYAAHGLRRTSELAGAYPYPVLTIAQTAGGFALEGPGMIWIPTGLTGSHLRWNVYHEIAHQWFYGMVGSDHALQPFADETLATHLGGVASGIWRDTGCRMKRLDLSIYRYSEACYFGQIYVRGADLMRTVRRSMASGEYFRAVRAYVAEYKWRIGSTRAFLETLQEHTNRNLEPILAPWFPSIY
jgi:hypothetical protein